MRCLYGVWSRYTHVGANVVEEELGAGGTADIHPTSEGDELVLVGFAVLEVGKVLFKVADIVGDMELGTVST